MYISGTTMTEITNLKFITKMNHLKKALVANGDDHYVFYMWYKMYKNNKLNLKQEHFKWYQSRYLVNAI